MSVDLPEPDGPISATNSPRSTVMSMPRRAWTAAPLEPKTFVRPWVLMIADMVSDLERSASRTVETRGNFAGGSSPGIQPSASRDRVGWAGTSPAPDATGLVVLFVLLDALLRRVLEADFLAGLQPDDDLDALERRDAGRTGTTSK